MENNNDILVQRLHSICQPSLPDRMAGNIMERIRRRERRRRVYIISISSAAFAVVMVGVICGLIYLKPELQSTYEDFFMPVGDGFRSIFGKIAAFTDTTHEKITLLASLIAAFYLLIGGAISTKMDKKV